MNLSALFAPLGKAISFVKKPDAYLCLDLGSHSVKLLEIEALDEPRLIRGGVSRLPDSALGSSVMQNPDAVMEGIKDLKARLRPKARLVLTSVPGPSAIIKKLTVPKSSELGAAIEKEAAHMIPESLDRVQWDYQILDGDQGSGDVVEVLLAAVKKEIIERTIELIREAGWEPALIDVDYFALENLFDATHPGAEGVVALLSIGSRATLIDIIRNGRSAFRGDISIGGREFTEAIMEQARVPFDEAETIKTKAWEAGVIPNELASPLESTIESLVQEVKRSLSLYWTFAMEEQVSSVYLCGGGTMVPGLSGHMERGLNVPVKVLDPLQALKLGPGVGSDLGALSPLLTVGAGLSFRRMDDR